MAHARGNVCFRKQSVKVQVPVKNRLEAQKSVFDWYVPDIAVSPPFVLSIEGESPNAVTATMAYSSRGLDAHEYSREFIFFEV